MKRLKLILPILLALGLFNCSDDDSGGDPTPQYSIEDFEGSWIASSATFTNKSNTSESVEFIAAGGEIRYTMLEGGTGRTRTWIEFENNPVDEWDAVITLGSNNTYVSTPAESNRPVQRGTFTIGNNTITLINENSTFDFTNSGTQVPATSITIFVPNN